ncbi:MAG: 30S ribosomal protein S1 [Candidatus Eisenbacteria bacterium]|uniref:Small ribosomal subunit protein bS1 n=1 Tax=Eiseniibacteriota bacterium TaxID=2212470 RepID=A0A7Y2E650_UNCEI|nr:30S ribosomal protein S1 [Candidatus Eisenbacteria bacterium]
MTEEVKNEEPVEVKDRLQEIHIINRQDDDDEEYDIEATLAMLNMVDESIKNLEEGEIVEGTVLRLDDKEVVVDIGGKSEGVISIDEFPDKSAVKVGDRIDVFLEKMENADGLVELSKIRADFVKVWDKVKESYDNNQVVEGKLLRKIKGGVVVDLFGVEAFLPGSQIALRQVQNTEDLLNQNMRFKIIKLNKRRRNIVVSRRVVLEEERAQLKDKILAELGKDQVREGIVKNITDFGAFVDLGGIDGLLHITDMSWGRVNHPSEVVTIGDKHLVKVLNFDPERERISLGLKQLTPYPWENVDEKFKEGTRVRGKVVSITDYGAFVELEKGVEGLIYISEMSWTRHVRHPSKIVKIGDVVECVVLKVDKENEKISLSLKQTETDPWETLDLKYPPGSRLSGRVRNLTNFGAFVELEEGIDGLVHISDMSWTKRINHPSEMVKKGEEVAVEVLNIDKAERRISLGLKQTQENPWPAIEQKFGQGSEVEGTIVRMIDRGVVVDLGDDVEGFVPLSQLGAEDKPEEGLKEGDKLTLKVGSVDVSNQRIVLTGLHATGVPEVEEIERMDPGPSPQDLQQRYSGQGSASIGDHLMDLAGGEGEAEAEPEATAEATETTEEAKPDEGDA